MKRGSAPYGVLGGKQKHVLGSENKTPNITPYENENGNVNENENANGNGNGKERETPKEKKKEKREMSPSVGRVAVRAYPGSFDVGVFLGVLAPPAPTTSFRTERSEVRNLGA